MRILALDMATKTGWAMNDPSVSGVENFAVRRGESPGMRFVRFVAWLEEIIEKARPDLVVYEQAHHRGGAATEVAVGLATHLQSTLARHGIDHTSYHTATIKKHATGRGNAGKEEMMAAYRERFGSRPVDDNEADARWALDLAMRDFGGRDGNRKAQS